MNIIVVEEEAHPAHLTGGEYAVAEVKVFIDGGLPFLIKQELVIHAVIECFCPSWPHEKVDELTELLADSLYQLENKCRPLSTDSKTEPESLP